mgnify:CR=1 FL=1
MDLSDWISIISIIVAIGALVYSILSNTKKYELTYPPKYYKDDERQGAQKTPQKASSYFFLQDTISIGQPLAIR